MHGMRRVGEAEVAQRVRQQEVGIVVRAAGHGHGKMRQQRQAQRDGQREQQEHAPTGPLGEPAGGRFERPARQHQRH
jgi:hypothetical protein